MVNEHEVSQKLNRLIRYFTVCKQVVALSYAKSYFCQTFAWRWSQLIRCLIALDAIHVSQKLDPSPRYFAPGKQVIACYYASSYFR